MWLSRLLRCWLLLAFQSQTGLEKLGLPLVEAVVEGEEEMPPMKTKIGTK